jgi:predicted secreted protein with PEFG-CTERM motif
MAVLLASVASVSTLGTAYAQTGFTVETDNTEYSTGEDITVSGNVGQTPTGQPLLIQVFNPNGAAYRFDQVTVAADGSYTYTFRVGGNLGVSGEYEVRVSYAGATANTTFDFTATGETELRNFTLVIDGTDRHTVQYKISGGTLRSLTGDSESATVTATISASSAGQLTLVFPRTVFDSMDSNGEDLDFIVFVDELETTAEDDFGEERRTLVIDFEQGSEQIDLVGTFLIPEFGAIAAVVLAVAIVGIIVATTRYSKFSFLPKM